MAWSKDEALQDRIREFHASLSGHRRYKYWPDVPKEQADLGVCEISVDHEFKKKSLSLDGKDYGYEITYCKKCPLAFIDPVVAEEKTSKK